MRKAEYQAVLARYSRPAININYILVLPGGKAMREKTYESLYSSGRGSKHNAREG